MESWGIVVPVFVGGDDVLVVGFGVGGWILFPYLYVYVSPI